MKNTLISPPFDFTNLILSKKKLLKDIKKINNNLINVKILGGYTFNNFQDWLIIFNYKNNINIKIENSDWGSAFQNTLTYLKLKKTHDVIILFNSIYDLLIQNSNDIDKNKIKLLLEIYKNFFEKLKKKNTTIIFNLFEYFHYNEIEQNNFKNKFIIDKLNEKLIKLIGKYNNIITINPTSNFNYANLNSVVDIRNWNFYGSLFNLEQSIMLAYNYSIAFRSIYGSTKKILVLDLDNTLWGGIVGDSNIKDLKIYSDDPEGRIYIQFQNFIKSLKNKGILLAICSKNDQTLIKKIFDKIDMPLKLGDFISLKINWKNKYLNILEILKELNLGLDSFVFLDDNPSEREEMRHYLPDVCTPDIGEDPSKFIEFLDLNQFFKNYSHLSKEDLKKKEMYLSLKKANDEKHKFLNHEDFLKSLNINIYINNLDNQNMSRVQQLINKTNQFNLITKRVSGKFLVNDIKKKWRYVISAKDKFGDHGIISFIYGSFNSSILYIDNWVLSCRVFNKYIENSIIYFISSVLINKTKIKKIQTNYLPTLKNKLLKQIFKDIGFTIIKEENQKIVYLLDLNNFTYIKNIVKVNDKR